MLVLTRETHQSIIIAEGEIEIEILEIRGNRCRVGITAPKDIPIDRKEIWLAKQEQETKNANMAAR